MLQRNYGRKGVRGVIKMRVVPRRAKPCIQIIVKPLAPVDGYAVLYIPSSSGANDDDRPTIKDT